jgi:hypothetical protein
MNAHYAHAEARKAQARKVPEIMPFDKAIRFITRQQHTKSAESNFATLVLTLPNYFGVRKRASTLRKLNAQIENWRRTGILRREVVELKALFEKSHDAVL